MTLAIDHVLFAVADLDGAARAVEARFGLTSVAGGRHPAWGTANRIVPLGDAYLELVAVAEPAVARTTTFGRWVAGGPSGRPLGWAVRTDDLDTIARRLALPIADGSRTTPDGIEIRWRSAGVAEAAADRSLPFFIEWADPPAFPGRTAVDHPGGAARLRGLTVTGDPRRLAAWLGDRDLPIEIHEGPAAVERAILSRGEDELLLEW